MEDQNIRQSEVIIMPRKKKETTTDSVKEVKEEVKTTKCSKYGFASLQNSAKLHVKGLRGTIR